jgi:hypothetical protein
LTHLPNGSYQVVVFQRPDAKEPIDIKAGANEAQFVSTTDGPLLGTLQIQAIDTILMPPGNLSSLIASESDLEGVGKAFDELKLTTSVDKLKGVTIFAPINEVSSRRQWYIWIED